MKFKFTTVKFREKDVKVLATSVDNNLFYSVDKPDLKCIGGQFSGTLKRRVREATGYKGTAVVTRPRSIDGHFRNGSYWLDKYVSAEMDKSGDKLWVGFLNDGLAAWFDAGDRVEVLLPEDTKMVTDFTYDYLLNIENGSAATVLAHIKDYITDAINWYIKKEFDVRELATTFNPILDFLNEGQLEVAVGLEGMRIIWAHPNPEEKKVFELPHLETEEMPLPDDTRRGVAGDVNRKHPVSHYRIRTDETRFPRNEPSVRTITHRDEQTLDFKLPIKGPAILNTSKEEVRIEGADVHHVDITEYDGQVYYMEQVIMGFIVDFTDPVDGLAVYNRIRSINESVPVLVLFRDEDGYILEAEREL